MEMDDFRDGESGEAPPESHAAGHGLNIGGLFSGKKEASQQPQVDVDGIMRDVTRRLRVLEERMTTDRKNIQLAQQNFITSSKKTDGDIKNTYAELNEIKKELAGIKDQIGLVVGELKDTAKKEDVTVMEKYIELWEPLNFVTKREVEAMIRRILNEKK
jgi:selenophosphate synthase